MTTAACDKDGSDDGQVSNQNNIVGKGDVPTGDWIGLCEEREADTTATGKPRFLSNAIRWPAADVEGVTADELGDDRGQEYAEYFVITKVPNQGGTAFEEQSVVLGHPSTKLDIQLNDEQKFFLEDEEEKGSVVGQCIFTSWHSDVSGPLPCEVDGTCPNILGQTVDEKLFRMMILINSNRASSDLVEECSRQVSANTYKTGDSTDETDVRHRDFMRGCGIANDLFQTHWRSSDSQICSAAMRFSECGCSVGGDKSITLGSAIIPSLRAQEEDGGISYRGFPLGTWSDASELPVGCKYVDIGKELDGKASQTIVSCDISAGTLLKRSEDPKEFCRQQYGEDVVVYVPIPESSLECDPPANGQYAGTCSDTPWVVSRDEQ